MSLHRLIYCSRPASVSRGDLEAILGDCRRNNPAVHLTGMLLFTSDSFMQLLEGGRTAVNTCFQRISRDTRHREIEVISCGPVDFRQFDRWSMHYVAQDSRAVRDLSRFATNDRFDPFAMTASAAEQLCVHLSLSAHQPEPAPA